MNSYKTKRRSVSRIVFIAVAAALLLGTTAFAAGVTRGGWLSLSEKQYSEVPTVEEFVDDVGYEPILVEQFQNGFKYVTGNVVNNEVSNDEGSVVDSFKSAMFEYEREGEILYFSQDRYDNINTDLGDLVDSYNGIDLRYYSYVNKVVPENYSLTAADIEAEKNGEVIFSYGSESIVSFEVRSVSWIANGIAYNMMQMDGSLDCDDLLAMAKEAINY